MSKPRTPQQLDLAALAAALDAPEHVAAAVLIAEAPPPVAPSAGLKARLMSRVAAYESV